MSDNPGADWINVPEGVEYTNEQAARKFLDLGWEHQVRVMGRMQEAMRAQTLCFIQDHAGAMSRVREHSCPPDRYQEGWRDGINELLRRMDTWQMGDVPANDVPANPINETPGGGPHEQAV